MVPRLRNSPSIYIVIQGNSVGVLFNGLLAELPAILNNFFTSTTSDYIGVVGSHSRSGKEKAHCVLALVLWINWCLKLPRK